MEDILKCRKTMKFTFGPFCVILRVDSPAKNLLEFLENTNSIKSKIFRRVPTICHFEPTAMVRLRRCDITDTIRLSVRRALPCYRSLKWFCIEDFILIRDHLWWWSTYHFSSYSRILELIDTLNDIQIVLKHLNIDINQLKYLRML